MKSVKILICGILLAIGTAQAADKQPANSPTARQTSGAKEKKEVFNWQQCVDDKMGESGYSKEQAYDLCNHSKK